MRELSLSLHWQQIYEQKDMGWGERRGQVFNATRTRGAPAEQEEDSDRDDSNEGDTLSVTQSETALWGFHIGCRLR
jgi:hypothetical protein